MWSTAPVWPPPGLRLASWSITATSKVNGKKVDIPSYQVRGGDVITVKERSKDLVIIQHAVDTLDSSAPEWMTVAKDSRTISIIDLPNRAQIDTPIQEQLIVELYSK